MNLLLRLFKPKSLYTADEIIYSLQRSLIPRDLEFIASVADPVEALTLHHTIGQYIRNTYGLWSVNPMTNAWRLNSSESDLHPDSVSQGIVNSLVVILRQERGLDVSGFTDPNLNWPAILVNGKLLKSFGGPATIR